jgi:GrpB-like predicted nucleotidyltransferase (UPF0157 family)/RimJ/RimL family protein N-acetyltransferase
MITLLPYSTQWPALFQQEKAKLLEVLAPLEPKIEHIGSTAIPGIHAKPVIDILIGVEDVNSAALIPGIVSLGYRYQPLFEKEFPHRRYFQKDNLEGIRTHQIHVVRHPSCWWDKHLLFRDYLRAHPESAKAYEQHKIELAKTHETTLTYAIAKTDFCRTIDQKAYFDFSIHQPAVSTERLFGYRPQLACFELYQSMFQDETFAASFGITLSEEKIQATLNKDMGLWDEKGLGHYAWFEKASGEFVGRGGLNRSTPDGKTEIELTYSLVPQCWGKGYATEIGKFALQEAFETLKLPDLVCFTAENNIRSLNVMKKLGFCYEKDFVYAGIRHKLFRIRPLSQQENFP